MAIVKIKFCNSIANLKNYLTGELKPDHVVSSHSCELETVDKNFKLSQRLNSNVTKNEAIHVVQSWNEFESSLKSKEDFNLMGVQLAERYFKGHEFVVVTHHDTGKMHNHIVVNPVHYETGKRVINKKKHLYKLRDVSDKICVENGLEVLQRTTNVRKDKMPNDVRRIVERGGHSYIMDIREKGRQAGEIATSFDEYRHFMGVMGINVRIEDKNITYFYPGRTKGKRGKTLGKNYDTEGLVCKFKENDLKFAIDPMTRKILEAKLHSMQSQSSKDGAGGRKKIYSNVDEWLADKNYSSFTKSDRRSAATMQISMSDLQRGPFPSDALERAKNASISSYCKTNHIGLVSKEGKTLLRGREYVELTGGQWKNTKNGTEGNTIDFVRIHKNTSLVKAISIINDDKSILAYEKFFQSKHLTFHSFYIPKEHRASEKLSKLKLSSFFRSMGVAVDKARNISETKRMQVHKDGRIRFMSENGADGYVDFHENKEGKWQSKPGGNMSNPYISKRGSSNRLMLFADIHTFIESKGEKAAIQPTITKHSILTLLTPSSNSVDIFLEQNRNIDEVFMMRSWNKSVAPAQVDLFEGLKKKYAKSNVRFEQIAPAKTRSKEGPDIDI